MPCRSTPGSVLHSPAPHSPVLDGLENQVLNAQAKQNHGKEAGENIGNQELILLLKNIPAEAAGAGTDSEHEFRGDQRPPRKRPANFESGENTRKGARDQNTNYVSGLRKPVVLADHP